MMDIQFLRSGVSRRLLAGGALIVAFAGAQPAFAATDTSNLAVSATVSANCNVTANALTFGNVDVTSGTDTDMTASFDVTCTSGAEWIASAGEGAGTGATLSDRKMTAGANTLSYDIYRDAGHTEIWGDGTGGTTFTITGTGTGAAQSSTIYGRVPLGQNTVPAGSYTDTVVVTVTY